MSPADDQATGDGGFFSRWSRLKRGAATPESAPAAVVEEPAAVPVEVPAETRVEAPSEPAFDLSLLPTLEELTPASDIRGFLHRAVPAGLRNAALKRMWALDPAIRDFVGPVDYAWDFNTPGGLPGIAEAMGGDVSEMLARVIGAAPPPQPPAVGEDVAEPAPPAALMAEAPSPEVLPLDVTVAEAAPAPPVARRHGSALPI